jgi:hypothetical protein
MTAMITTEISAVPAAPAVITAAINAVITALITP